MVANILTKTTKRAIQSGDRFGRLVVVGPLFNLPYDGKYQSHAVCLCDCGEYAVAMVKRLRIGHMTSCGCRGGRVGIGPERLLAKRTNTKPGDRFDRLTVLGDAFRVKEEGRQYSSIYVVCQCECGKVFATRERSLTTRAAKSCGCGQREAVALTGVKNATHGDSGTRLYTIWCNIKARCGSPKEPAYKDYGGRGITICDEWKSDFVAFKTWAMANGYAGSLSIDRVDNDGNYCGDNCRWTDAKTQGNNKRDNHILDAFDERKTMSEWSDDPRCVVGYDLLESRINAHGWEAERAITTQKQGKQWEAFGEKKTLPAWGRDPRCKVKPNTLKARVTIQRGWSFEDALTTPVHHKSH